MTQITDRGRKLASKLNPAIGTTREIEETCSLIARHAKTHGHIQETWCSVELSDRQTARLMVREAALERRIVDLIEHLPDTDEGPWAVLFGGDPRGHTVKLVAPGSLVRFHDDWGQEGIGADV
jgi:hypothetical protein